MLPPINVLQVVVKVMKQSHILNDGVEQHKAAIHPVLVALDCLQSPEESDNFSSCKLNGLSFLPCILTFFYYTSLCLIDSASRMFAVESKDNSLWILGLWDPFQNNEVVQECGKVTRS